MKRNYLFLTTLSLLTLTVHQAKAVLDMDKAVEQSRTQYYNRFSKFTQNKNVMGVPRTPKGGEIQAEQKTRMDADGGKKLSFRSDLTHHIEMKHNFEPADPKNPKSKARLLAVGTSTHGKLTQAGGSSKLERGMYKIHDQLSQFDESDTAKQQLASLDKQGIQNIGIQQVQTKDVFENPNNPKPPAGAASAKATNPQDKKEKEKVSRTTMRKEADDEATKIGEESFEEVSRAAKEVGRENQASDMENITMLRQAAKEATEAMYVAAQSRWGQRAIINGVREDNPSLSADTPNIENWVKQERQRFTRSQNQTPPKDQNEAAQRQKELQQKEQEWRRIQDQANQIASMKASSTINPRFERGQPDDKGNPTPDKLVQGEINKEDGLLRDLRGQIFVMENGGKSISQMPSNWQYNKKDESFKVNEYDQNGNNIGTKEKTVADQYRERNAQLDSADKGYDEVIARNPIIQKPDLSPYYIKEGTPIMEVNKQTSSTMSEFGIQAPPESILPQTYKEVLEVK